MPLYQPSLYSLLNFSLFVAALNSIICPGNAATSLWRRRTCPQCKQVSERPGHSAPHFGHLARSFSFLLGSFLGLASAFPTKPAAPLLDRKSTRLNSSHITI